MATALSDVRGVVRLLLGTLDDATATLDFSNADLLIHINAAYRWWFDNSEKRVKAVTLVATAAQGIYVQAMDAAAVYPEILEVTLDSTYPLEPMAWSELRNRQQADGTEARPTHYAIRKLSGAAPTGTAQNKWDIALFPIADASYSVEGLVRDYPTALSADGDVLYVGDFEGRVLIPCYATILAAEGAGRPDLAEDLIGLFPEMVRDRLVAHSSREEVMP